MFTELFTVYIYKPIYFYVYRTVYCLYIQIFLLLRLHDCLLLCLQDCLQDCLMFCCRIVHLFIYFFGFNIASCLPFIYRIIYYFVYIFTGLSTFFLQILLLFVICFFNMIVIILLTIWKLLNTPYFLWKILLRPSSSAVGVKTVFKSYATILTYQLFNLSILVFKQTQLLLITVKQVYIVLHIHGV